MRYREALRWLNEVKSVKNMIRKLKVENERKIAWEFEINQNPFKSRRKKGSGLEIMGPSWKGKCNLFTEVVDIAINFNDFSASASRLEKEDISRDIYLHISEKEDEINIMLQQWLIYQTIQFLANYRKNWKPTWISESSINK